MFPYQQQVEFAHHRGQETVHTKDSVAAGRFLQMDSCSCTEQLLAALVVQKRW